jgi:IclR family KDG regulon transcriptional repressor
MEVTMMSIGVCAVRRDVMELLTAPFPATTTQLSGGLTLDATSKYHSSARWLRDCVLTRTRGLCMLKSRRSISYMKSTSGDWKVKMADYHVPSVALAAQALKLLSRQKYKSCSLKEIAEKLHASPTTCLRTLRTLEQEDFVCCDRETKKYSLGPYLIPLGNRAAQMNDAISRASAEVKRIAAITGLTTALIQRWDGRLIYIAEAEPLPGDTRFTRLSVTVGEPTHQTIGAHGRCFLAYEDEVEWRRRIATGIPALTPNTITDPERFIAALRGIKRNGYAISHGEFHFGASAVDVPVFGPSGEVDLVVSCMYITLQMDESHLAEVIDLLRATSRKLSEWNGYPVPQGDETPLEIAGVGRGQYSATRS